MSARVNVPPRPGSTVTDRRPLIDWSEAPWTDVELRFALMSVVLAAKFWVADPNEDHAALLRKTVEICDHTLVEWNERQR